MKLRVHNLRQLLYWMTERQKIYLARAAGCPPPWTRDPILRRWRFCNTYSEQDRETVWLRENWLQPYKDHPNLWFAVCLFRQINWSPTLQEIGFPTEWDPGRVLHVLERRQARGEKVYTSAYLIPSPGEREKTVYTVKRVLDPLWKRVAAVDFATLQSAHAWFRQFFGFGPFLSYEVVSDLRHTRYLSSAPDIYTWAHPGPGAKRGLNRLLGRALKAPLRVSDQVELMQEVMAWVQTKRDPVVLPTLEMRDIEHSLCEMDKYARAQERLKQGRCIGLESFKSESAIHAGAGTLRIRPGR